MPRTSRKQSESGIFHVMARGIDRQVIFHDDEDCEKYLQCLSDCKKDADFTLYAFCLMGNHLHLLVRPQAEPLRQGDGSRPLKKSRQRAQCGKIEA